MNKCEKTNLFPVISFRYRGTHIHKFNEFINYCDLFVIRKIALLLFPLNSFLFSRSMSAQLVKRTRQCKGFKREIGSIDTKKIWNFHKNRHEWTIPTSSHTRKLTANTVIFHSPPLYAPLFIDEMHQCEFATILLRPRRASQEAPSSLLEMRKDGQEEMRQERDHTCEEIREGGRKGERGRGWSDTWENSNKPVLLML